MKVTLGLEEKPAKVVNKAIEVKLANKETEGIKVWQEKKVRVEHMEFKALTVEMDAMEKTVNKKNEGNKDNVERRELEVKPELLGMLVKMEMEKMMVELEKCKMK